MVGRWCGSQVMDWAVVVLRTPGLAIIAHAMGWTELVWNANRLLETAYDSFTPTPCITALLRE